MLPQMETWCSQVQNSSMDAISRCTVMTTTVNSVLPTCSQGQAELVAVPASGNVLAMCMH